MNHPPPAGAAQRIDPRLLLRAYALGLFPMADGRETLEIFWVEPRRRGILPLDGFHLSRRLARTIRQRRFRVTADRAFDAVILSCAAAQPGREESWINRPILEAYRGLARSGHAHSIEVWNTQGALVGGLYGVRLAGAFFGESMFSAARDASKVALAHLVARLKAGGFRLVDTQFLSDHLRRMGAIEVRRQRYLMLLDDALAGGGDWRALDAGAPAAPPLPPPPETPLGLFPAFAVDPALLEGADNPEVVLQLISQTS